MVNWIKEHRIGFIVSLIAILMTIAWGYSWHFVRYFGGNREAWGQFGDSFGAINALFSGLAFVGVIYAVLLQKEELRLQRDELKQTRGEFEKQNETLESQRFENTFFQLIRLYDQVVDDVTVNNDGGQPVQGREAFTLLYKKLKKSDAPAQLYTSMSDASTDLSNLLDEYARIYKRYERTLAIYFRTIYRILKFIDLSEISDKDFYVSILRAQMTNHECIAIFYSCLRYDGESKLKTLIERYRFFRSLDKGLLFRPVHETIYQSTAYESLPSKAA